MKIKALLLAIATLAIAAVPAGATHGGVHPTFRSEAVYFHCTGDTKVYQVNWLSTLGATTSYSPWDTTAPTQSVQAGAGCGSADLGGISNPLYSPTFTGTFNGNVRDITVRLHHLAASRLRTGQAMDVQVHAEIDGVPLFAGDAGGGGVVTVKPVASSTGASELFEFTITNIGYATDVLDAEGNVVGVETGGAALEDGDGDDEHILTLMIGLDEYPRPGVWAWDTTEVPSGMTFNPETPAAATLKATLPQF